MRAVIWRVHNDRKYLQGSRAFIGKALDKIILGFCKQLLGFPPAVWQRNCSISQVVQDRSEMFATAINQNPTLTRNKKSVLQSQLLIGLKHRSAPLANVDSLCQPASQNRLHPTLGISLYLDCLLNENPNKCFLFMIIWSKFTFRYWMGIILFYWDPHVGMHFSSSSPSLSVRTSILPLNMAFSMVSCLVRVCIVV